MIGIDQQVIKVGLGHHHLAIYVVRHPHGFQQRPKCQVPCFSCFGLFVSFCCFSTLYNLNLLLFGFGSLLDPFSLFFLLPPLHTYHTHIPYSTYIQSPVSTTPSTFGLSLHAILKINPSSSFFPHPSSYPLAQASPHTTHATQGPPRRQSPQTSSGHPSDKSRTSPSNS